MKPLAPKLAYLRGLGLGVSQRGTLLYVYGPRFRRVRARTFARHIWIVNAGSVTYRGLREGLRRHFPWVCV